MHQDSTSLEAVSSQVPDSELGPVETEADKRKRVMEAVAPRLNEVAERLSLIERALAGAGPEFIKEQPIGHVVDVIADIKNAIERLHGDGSTVITNMLKARYRFFSEVSLPERLDNDGIKNFSTDRFRISKSTKVLASIKPEHKDDAYQWLRDHDSGDLIKPTVNASSLSALAKELMEGGKELPDDYFNVHPKVAVSFTRVGARRGE